MAELKINTLYEVNGYLNGISMFAQQDEITIPGIKPKMADHKGLGIAGSISIPTGFDKMGAKFKANSLYPSVMAEFANIYKEHTAILFGNLQKWEGNALVSEVPAQCTIKGKSKGTPDIGIKHQDNPELEYELDVSSVKLEVEGVTIYHLDLIANIYIVNGVDLWAQRRDNLGL